MKIGENIRRIRRMKDMTQENLADCLNVTVSAVSQWESGSGCPDRHTSAYFQPVFCNSHDLPLR